MTNLFANGMELEIAQKAVETYRKELAKVQQQKENLNDEKFSYGQYVTTSNGEPGKILGFEYGVYIVFVSSSRPSETFYEEDLTLLDNPPTHFVNIYAENLISVKFDVPQFIYQT